MLRATELASLGLRHVIDTAGFDGIRSAQTALMDDLNAYQRAMRSIVGGNLALESYDQHLKGVQGLADTHTEAMRGFIGSDYVKDLYAPELRRAVHASSAHDLVGGLLRSDAESLLSNALGLQLQSADWLSSLGLRSSVVGDVTGFLGSVSFTHLDRAARDLASSLGVTVDNSIRDAHIAGFSFQDLAAEHLGELGELLSEVPLPPDVGEAGTLSEEASLSYLGVIIQYAQRVGGKRAVAVFLLLLTFLLKAVIEEEVQFYSAEVFKPVRAHVLKKLLPLLGRRVPAGTPPVLINRLRLVAAHNLRVRVCPRRNDSRVITLLNPPDVVIELRRRSDWSLVEYSDGDATIHGWVLTRYLAPLRIPKQNISSDE